jgi:hypothetical protein
MLVDVQIREGIAGELPAPSEEAYLLYLYFVV